VWEQFRLGGFVVGVGDVLPDVADVMPVSETTMFLWSSGHARAPPPLSSDVIFVDGSGPAAAPGLKINRV
jgi:hypothetical protein